MHVAGIAEKVRCAPEQLDARTFLLIFEDLGHGIEIRMTLSEGAAFGRDVAIVEGVERRAEFLKEFKGCPDPVAGILD